MKKLSFYVFLWFILLVFIPASFASDSLNITTMTYALIGGYRCSENFTISDEQVSTIKKWMLNSSDFTFSVMGEHPDLLFRAYYNLSEGEKADVMYIQLSRDYWVLEYDLHFEEDEFLKAKERISTYLSQTDGKIYTPLQKFTGCSNPNPFLNIYNIYPEPKLNCDIRDKNIPCRNNEEYLIIQNALGLPWLSDYTKDPFTDQGNAVYIFFSTSWNETSKVFGKNLIFSNEISFIKGIVGDSELKNQVSFFVKTFYPIDRDYGRLVNLSREINDYTSDITEEGKKFSVFRDKENISNTVMDYEKQLASFQEAIDTAKRTNNIETSFQGYYGEMLSVQIEEMEALIERADNDLSMIRSYQQWISDIFYGIITGLVVTLVSSLSSMIMYDKFIKPRILKKQKEEEQDQIRDNFNKITSTMVGSIQKMSSDLASVKVQLNDNQEKETEMINELKTTVKKIDTSLSRVYTSVTHLSKDINNSLNESNEKEEKMVSILREIKEELKKSKE